MRKNFDLLWDSNIKEYEIDPKTYDIHQKNFKDLQIESPFDSLDLIKATLGNEDFKAGENIVSLNSAAVIYVSGIARNFESALKLQLKL